MSIQDLINQATKNVDHTETTSGGDFEYTPPPAGKTVGVFIEYIELGKQKQPAYKGQEKPDAEMVRLTFALTHPKINTKEIEVEGGTKKIQDRISFNVSIKLGEKAKFKKLFNCMRYGRNDITHMAQMLGDKFILEVFHNESGEGDNKRTYANLWNDQGTIGVQAPRQDDAISGTSTDIREHIPAALDPMKVFFWNNPTKETWDSIFIDGTRTVKEDGKDVEKSKNWLQEYILGATDFKGSALHTMLSGMSDIHQEAQKQAEVNEHEELPDQKQDKSADDALAALGLS